MIIGDSFHSGNCGLNIAFPQYIVYNIKYTPLLEGNAMTDQKKILTDVLRHMEYFEDMGVKAFDLYQEDMPFTIREEFIDTAELDLPQVPPNQLDIKAEKLYALQQLTKNCQKCSLFYTRKHVVFGRGDAKGCIMFVGGYPSEIDDFSDMLYNGKEGELLNRIIKAMQVSLSEIFITTAVKCHPPGLTKPREEEIQACIPYLKSQIEIIQPDIIVTLGDISYTALTQNRAKIFSQREHWEVYQGIPLLSTYDLEQIQNNPSIKKDVWRDLKSVLRKYHEIKALNA